MQSFVSISLLYNRVHAIKIKIHMKHVSYSNMASKQTNDPMH